MIKFVKHWKLNGKICGKKTWALKFVKLHKLSGKIFENKTFSKICKIIKI